MNRCLGYTKNSKKCRAKTVNKLFCCSNHEPINNDILERGCFICMEKIEKTNKIVHSFKTY